MYLRKLRKWPSDRSRRSRVHALLKKASVEWRPIGCIFFVGDIVLDVGYVDFLGMPEVPIVHRQSPLPMVLRSAS